MAQEEKMKVCSICGQLLPLSSFSPNMCATDGHQPMCKHCATTTRRRYDWRGHNMAFERIPWPFDDDEHEMNMDEVHNYNLIDD